MTESAAPHRVAVIGLGTISKYYLAAIDELPGWELAAVCDVRRSALAVHRGHVPGFLDHRDLLATVALDAVIVVVPNDVHARICRDALRAGVPVCVEKPLGIDLDEARALTELATERTPLFTAFHRRYNDNVLRLRDELRGHGPIESLVVRYLERIEEHIGGDTWYLDPDRCGGGCVADNGPNAFDLVRLFLGDVESAGVTVGRDESGIDRQAVLGLRSATGVPAVVELDWSHPGETKDVEVRCADGTVHRADMLHGHRGFKASLWHEYVGILADFATVLDAGGADAARRPDGGLAALELVDAVYRTEFLDTAPEWEGLA
ncbi:Gfo/Idh/MocA family oxidoreductase [Saccharopolyspora sp. NFXS83]|uniref:Gfo/Idh/MocA family protein n=1 Tax=Saccharopolyspora sp. NFXS83 TaxID=2993560 RepID=UPI00224ADF6B|nr:Gfo/Idh/MocA family oxidoreductase [Saccharopolyspora sp. NFXS83]MCX2729647.1 Gfo/Idh/MocA family oxidoreductase [Saccharopolyspora sp. NFXS83]